MLILKNKKVIYAVVIAIIVIILLAVMLNSYGTKGTQPIANRTIAPLYNWKSGALLVKGKVTPDSCALTTKNCSCNLSESSTQCIFNFDFSELDHNVHMRVLHEDMTSPSISYTKNLGCKDTDSNQIKNCSITFTWDKNKPGSEKVQLQLIGTEGEQTLINLQIDAK